MLDLNDNRFIEAIVRQFLGNVSALSAQKFSSNVVEKCIRVADATGRRAIIDELLNKQRLERLLRDSYVRPSLPSRADSVQLCQLRRADRVGLRRAGAARSAHRDDSSDPAFVLSRSRAQLTALQP